MSAPALRQLLRIDLMPLLSARHFGAIAQPLGTLMEAVGESDSAFAARFVESAMRKWPRSAPAKQPLFLELIVRTVGRISPQFYEGTFGKLCGFLAQCAQSQHSQVALAALQACSNGIIVRCFVARLGVNLSDALDVARAHWDPAVRQAADDTDKVIHSIDGHSPGPQIRPIARRPLRQDWGWVTVVNAAASKDSTVKVGLVLAQIQSHRDECVLRSHSRLRVTRLQTRLTIQ
jgi:hypothetical protein